MNTRPAWVMAGEDNGPAGVTLWASTTLTEAELTREIDFGDVMSQVDGRIYPHRQRITLTASMSHLVAIRADDWPDAFRKLFHTWSPQVPKELTP